MRAQGGKRGMRDIGTKFWRLEGGENKERRYGGQEIRVLKKLG